MLIAAVMANKEYQPLPASEPHTIEEEEQNLLPTPGSSSRYRSNEKHSSSVFQLFQSTITKLGPLSTLVIGYILGILTLLIFRICFSSSCNIPSSTSQAPQAAVQIIPAPASFPADIGSTHTHAWPPHAPTNAIPSLFPTKVGYPGPAETGAEPGLVLTAGEGMYPSWKGTEGLARPPVWEGAEEELPVWIEEDVGRKKESFNIFKNWGNLTPFHSVPSDSFGIKSDTGPEVPSGCTLKGVHILHRHGARYPTGWGTLFIFHFHIHIDVYE